MHAWYKGWTLYVEPSSRYPGRQEAVAQRDDLTLSLYPPDVDNPVAQLQQEIDRYMAFYAR
jgi:hypothetical protein